MVQRHRQGFSATKSDEGAVVPKEGIGGKDSVVTREPVEAVGYEAPGRMAEDIRH